MIQRATPEEYFKSIYGIERIKREQERQKEREFDKALKEIDCYWHCCYISRQEG